MPRKRTLTLIALAIPLAILTALYLPGLLKPDPYAQHLKRLNEILATPSTSPGPSTTPIHTQLVLYNTGSRNIAYRHDPIANTLQQIHPDTDNPTLLDPASRYALLTTGPNDKQARIYDALTQETIFSFEGLHRCFWFTDGVFWIMSEDPLPEHPNVIALGTIPEKDLPNYYISPSAVLEQYAGKHTSLFVLPTEHINHNRFLDMLTKRLTSYAVSNNSVHVAPFSDTGVLAAVNAIGTTSQRSQPLSEWRSGGCSNDEPVARPIPGAAVGHKTYRLTANPQGGGVVTWDDLNRESWTKRIDPRIPFRTEPHDTHPSRRYLEWHTQRLMFARDPATYNIPKDQTFNLLSGADNLLFVQTKPDNTPHNHTLYRLQTHGVLTTIADNITGLAINHHLAVYRDDTTLYAIPVADGEPTTIATLDPDAPAHAQDLLGARNERGPLLITTPTTHYLIRTTPTGIEVTTPTLLAPLP